MPVVQIDNNAIRYRHSPSDEPKAPTLLLLHMAGSSSVVWSSVLQRLGSAGVEVLAPDLPGHGQSEGDPLGSIDEMAAFAFAFLDSQGLSAAHFGGHSMGGGIAMAAALAQPSRVRSLLLVSTSAKLGVAPVVFDMIDNHFDTLGAFFGQQMGGSEAADPSLGTPIFPQADQQGVRADFAACNVFDVRDRLAEIRCPAAVMVGRDDVMTPVPGSEKLAQGLPSARLFIEEGCGHLLPRQRPSQVAAVALDLIQIASPS